MSTSNKKANRQPVDNCSFIGSEECEALDALYAVGVLISLRNFSIHPTAPTIIVQPPSQAIHSRRKKKTASTHVSPSTTPQQTSSSCAVKPVPMKKKKKNTKKSSSTTTWKFSQSLPQQQQLPIQPAASCIEVAEPTKTSSISTNMRNRNGREWSFVAFDTSSLNRSATISTPPVVPSTTTATTTTTSSSSTPVVLRRSERRKPVVNYHDMGTYTTFQFC